MIFVYTEIDLLGGKPMNEIGSRLRTLRESLHISQKKISEIISTTQSSINRYETGQSVPPPKVLIWYADYFDISMDYIFGRTDKPQGKLYKYEPEAIRQITENNAELKQFVDMCFDPKSPMSERLKKTLVQMLGEVKK
jgi:transcriptional regulator with XRE-family HTH domain